VVVMRTGLATGHHGYLHEAILYGGDDELLDVAVPFLRGGLDAGEPTLVGFGDRHAQVLKAAMPGAGRIRFLAGGAVYARPASAIAAYRKLLAEYVAGGAQQIRIIGELSLADFGGTWDWWARYESAINELYDEFPLWSMCAYDTRTTPVHVLDDVARTHPSAVRSGDVRVPSPNYLPPAAFLTSQRSSSVDPLQSSRPLATMVDAPLADIRRTVEAANTVGLSPEVVDHLKVAVNEVVTNALQHGHPPVEVRYWAGDGRIVISVTNKGGAPADPFAGLRPAAHAPNGGLGLWLAHQLCDFVRLDRGTDAFTVTLAVGAMPLPFGLPIP
jgi:anti-sigma regulatory factor (Ser/Thr protein kinase)